MLQAWVKMRPVYITSLASVIKSCLGWCYVLVSATILLLAAHDKRYMYTQYVLDEGLFATLGNYQPWDAVFVLPPSGTCFVH